MTWVIADFNNDGKQDFAAANFNGASVSVRVGNGLGGFSGTTTVGVGLNPGSIALGDFNNDGKQDFATADFSSNAVSIRLGDGLGGFSNGPNVSVGTNPYDLAIGDFNNDGKQDITTANSTANNLSIRLGSCAVAFSIDNVTLAEGPSGTTAFTFTVTKTGTTGLTTSVSFATAPGVTNPANGGTCGGAGVDYASISGSLSFLPTDTSKPITVNVCGDAQAEADETFVVNLSAPVNAIISDNQGLGTITNDDTDVSVAVSPSSVTEDGATNLVYTFTRTGVTTGTLTVNFSVGGSAAFGTDYGQSGAATFTTTSGTVTFTGSNTTAVVTLDPSVDSTVEPDETAVLTVTSGTGYNVGSPSVATGTITNDDTDVSVAVSPASVLEDGAPNLVYTFTRNGVTTGTLTVNFSVGGTALFGTDYGYQSGATSFTPPTGTVTFGAGNSTATVTLNPTTDNVPEANETVILTVTSGTGYTVGSPSAATGTITNDDTAETLVTSHCRAATWSSPTLTAGPRPIR